MSIGGDRVRVHRRKTESFVRRSQLKLAIPANAVIHDLWEYAPQRRGWRAFVRYDRSAKADIAALHREAGLDRGESVPQVWTVSGVLAANTLIYPCSLRICRGSPVRCDLRGCLGQIYRPTGIPTRRKIDLPSSWGRRPWAKARHPRLRHAQKAKAWMPTCVGMTRLAGLWVNPFAAWY